MLWRLPIDVDEKSPYAQTGQTGVAEIAPGRLALTHSWRERSTSKTAEAIGEVFRQQYWNDISYYRKLFF